MNTPSHCPLPLAEIGRQLRAARDRAGLTQTAVGQLLGVHFVTVSRWESGTRVPSLDVLYRLAAAYGCAPRDLLPAA